MTYTHLIVLLLVVPSLALANDSICYPAIDYTKPQYIIGYGSLINEASKQATAKNTGPNIPIEVHGFERGWYTLIAEQIFLGVKKNSLKSFNAVAFLLKDHAEIAAFDERESGYCRVKVPIDKITFLAQDKMIGELWIYVPQQPKETINFAEANSVAASYIYTFLHGCQEIERNFALPNYTNNCIEQTSAWPFFVTYDLDNIANLLKSRVFSEADNLATIEKLLCHSRKVIKNIRKDSDYYNKVCASLRADE